MTTKSVQFQFICGPDSNLTFNHDLPTPLIQAATSGTSPAFRQAYVQAVAPIMQQRQEECRKATQANCSVCDVGRTKQVLTTPISNLHLKDEPKVVVLVTPICEKQQCETTGKAMINEMVLEATGSQQTKVNNQDAPSRNAHCPCGSSRKYKKCCGSATTNDDVD